jgi:hypothetical protein
VRFVASGIEATMLALIERRRVWFDGWRDCPIFDRERMDVGL